MKKRFVLLSALMCLVCCLFGLAACGDTETDTFDVTVSTAVEHGTLTPDKTKAAEGETVTVTATPENGYSFKENSLTVNGEAQQGLTFTMPAENVELSATFVKDTVLYTVTLTTDTTKGTLSASKTKAEAGETITITPHPASGWAISAVKVDGTAINASAGVYTFTMPEKNVTVTGEFVEAVYNITIDPVEHVTITADKSTAKYNEQVTLTVQTDTGFVVDNILVNGTPSSATFTMPAEDVVITAQVTQVSGENFGYNEDIGLDPIPASNWDLSHDFGSGAYITVQSTTNALIYHTTAPTAEFYFEAKITVNETKPAANNPATGIVIRDAADNAQRIFFYANGRKVVHVMNANNANDSFDYAWEGDTLGNLTNDFEGGGGFTLGVARKGMYLYFFIDGQFASAKMYPNLDGTCYIGFLMFDDCRDVKYSDYTLTTAATEVDTKIGEHLVVEGDNFGYSTEVPVTPSAGWDLSEDNGDHPKLKLNTEGNASILLKQSAVDFYFTTKINIAELSADGNPTTGIVVQKASDPAQRIYFYLRAVRLATTNEVMVMAGASDDMFNYTWNSDEVAKAGKAYHDEGATLENYITLGLLKKGGTLYFYVNEVLVKTETKWEAQVGTTDTCYIGLQKMGVNKATYFDYTFTKEVDSMFHSITVSQDVTNGTLTPSKTSAVAGETITVDAQAEGGYFFKAGSLTVNSQAQARLTFTMPDDDVVLGGTFEEEKEKFNITLDFEDTLGILTADAEEASEGMLVTLTVEPNRGAYLEKVTVTLDGETETPIEYSNGYSFTMPGNAVTVKAYFYKGENFGYSTEVPMDPSAGWDLLGDKGGEPTLKLETGTGAKIYLNKASADFWFETRLNIEELQQDGNPTTGILIQKSNTEALYFFLRALNLGQDNEIRIMPVNNVDGYDYAWSGIIIGKAGKAYSGGAENYLTLAVAKIGGDLYFYVNSALVYVGSHYLVGQTDKCYVGLVGMGIAKATWSNYSFITEKAEVESKVGDAKITEAKAPDWTQGLTSVAVTGSEDYDGLGVTFYAKKVDGGVKVAAVATHTLYTYTEGNWWLNTNFEFFSASKQFYLTARVSGCDAVTDAVSFYTVYNADTQRYTTVAECFIADSQLTIENGAARLGFAWKTPGDQCNNGKNGTNDYWLVPEHEANDAGQQYYVTAEGILDTAPAAD